MCQDSHGRRDASGGHDPRTTSLDGGSEDPFDRIAADDPPDCTDPRGPSARAFRWLRVAKVLLGLVVSALTALELLGLLP